MTIAPLLRKSGFERERLDQCLEEVTIYRLIDELNRG